MHWNKRVILSFTHVNDIDLQTNRNKDYSTPHSGE
nr:MAG TPA: hypothetical protein [Caudoviricetes sp.]